MTWWLIGASVISAGAGMYGADQAGKAQGKAAEQNAALARQNLAVQLGLVEPARALGYGAQSDLASLYGYNLPEYQTGDELMNPAPGSSGPISVNGRQAKTDYLNPAGVLGIGGNKDKKLGGSIDPRTGTVTVDGNPALSAKYTEYLRTGNLSAIGGKAAKKNSDDWRIYSAVEGLRSSGWKYDPEAIKAAEDYSPVGQPTGGKITPPGGTGAGGYDKTPEGAGGTSPDGTAGNFGRFFTSPDYLFRQQEGTRAIDRSAAARSGPISGNVIKAQTGYASDLASSEYGNYVNRLLAIANGGSAANTQAGGSLDNATAALANSNTQQGDARASSILGITNTIGNAANSAVNNYAMLKYVNAAGGSPDPMKGLGEIYVDKRRI
jgi:hypothetical protein